MKKINLKKLLVMAVSMLFSVTAFSQLLTFSNVYGTPGNEAPSEYMISQPSGNIYYCGRTNDVASLTLIDPCGNILFDRQYYYPGLTSFHSMTFTDSGDLLLLANVNEDWLVMRVTPMGATVWTKIYSNARERSSHIINSINDTYFIVGWWAPSGTSDDLTVIKIDGFGTQVGARRYNNVDDQVFDVIADGQGGLVATGGLHSAVDMFAIHIDQNLNILGGSRYWQVGINRFEARSIAQAANGDFLFLGVSSTTTAWNPTVLTVLRTDPNFNPIWQRDFTIGTLNGSLGIQEGTNGHVYFTTRATWAGGNYAITELDALGNMVQSQMVPDYQTLQFNENGSVPYHLYDRIMLTGVSNINPFGANDEIFEVSNLNLKLCNPIEVDPFPTNVNLTNSPWNPTPINIVFNVQDIEVDRDAGKEYKILCDCQQSELTDKSHIEGDGSDATKEESDKFSIYPNITDGGTIHLVYELENNSVAQLEVVDMVTGQRIKNLSIDLKDTDEMIIDLGSKGVGHGVYQFTILSGDQVLKQRLVVR